jgi:hypothetical protein
MNDRIEEIVQMARELRYKMVFEHCYGCINSCGSQKDHPCLWDNGEEYKTEALARLYGQGKISEDEYTEALIYL